MALPFVVSVEFQVVFPSAKIRSSQANTKGIGMEANLKICEWNVHPEARLGLKMVRLKIGYHHVSSCIIMYHLIGWSSSTKNGIVGASMHTSFFDTPTIIYSYLKKLKLSISVYVISPIFRFFSSFDSEPSKHQSHKSNWIRWPTRRFDHAPRYWSVESPSVFHRTKSGPAIWVSPSTRWNTSSKSSKQAPIACGNLMTYRELWNINGLENTHDFWSYRSCASCFSACSWCP